MQMVDSVDDLKSSSSIRGTSMPNFEVLDARIASALNRIIPNSHFKKKNQSGGTEGPEAGPSPSRQADCLLDLRIFPGSLEPMILSRTMPTYLFTISLRNDDIQEFDSKWGRNIIVYDENPA